MISDLSTCVYLKQRKLGPGSYDLKDFLEAADDKPKSIHGICETKEERFKDKIRVSELRFSLSFQL